MNIDSRRSLGLVACVAMGLSLHGNSPLWADDAATVANPGAATPTASAVTPVASPVASPVAAPGAAPAPASSAASDQTFDFFLAEAKVTTASRREQKKSDSPVAIDVITQDDIRRSGAQNIADLLRYRAGVNVEEATGIEGNRQLINVRGLPDEFAQSLLVLIDGRSIVSPVDQGVFWENIPVALDDIERIEIVRGPNSALFGSNAGQGVINIITKKPGDADAVDARAEVGSYHAHRGYASANASTLLGDVRVSLQDQAREDSWTDPYGNLLANGNKDTDFMRANARMDSHPWDGGELESFLGGSKDEYSVPSVLGISGYANNSDYEMLKMTQKLNDSMSLEFNASRDDVNRGSGLQIVRETQWAGELLARISAMQDRSQSVVGVSFRHEDADSAYIFNDFIPGDAAKAQNRIRRGFLSEAYSFSDWITLNAAGSYENSDTGGDQEAYQGALVVKPMEDWGLRLSASRAPTLPSMLNKYSNITLPVSLGIPIAFAPAPLNGLGAAGYTSLNEYYHLTGSNMTASTVSSYEATLSGSVWDKRIGVEVTPYQMEISGYPEFQTTGYTTVAPVPPPPGLTTVYETTNLQYINDYAMVLRGVETSLTLKPMLGTKIQLNHTYEDVYSNDMQSGDKRYLYTTPWNMLNAIVTTDLIWGFDAGMNLGWTGQHYVDIASRSAYTFVPDQARLDLRLGYNMSKSAEFYVLGQNLVQEYRLESPDGTAVPQAYYAGLDIKWGGVN